MTGLFAKFAALALVSVCVAFSTTAQAQMVCGARGEIIKQLEKKYGETRRSLGLQQGRGVVEIYASAKTGSWTILVTDARGKSCLMAAGEAFEIEAVAEVDTPT
ncbi:MAG: hypothetical protein AAGD13_09345 [Pseudomonadota bacterium]